MPDRDLLFAKKKKKTLYVAKGVPSESSESSGIACLAGQRTVVVHLVASWSARPATAVTSSQAGTWKAGDGVEYGGWNYLEFANVIVAVESHSALFEGCKQSIRQDMVRALRRLSSVHDGVVTSFT